MFDTSWDVEKYKTDHESDEHWELRREFMVAHQSTLPEDEVVCMAQVFTNIEFLGCRYPIETMVKVASLAQGVVEDFREKKKNSLKPIFVAASGAATSKVKGLHRQSDALDQSDQSAPVMKQIINFIPSSEPQNSVQVHQTDVLGTSASNSDPTRCDVESLNLGQMKCSIYIDGQKASEASAVTAKDAKDMAVSSALENLKQQCSALVVKSNTAGQNVKQFNLDPIVNTGEQQVLGKQTESNNIGGKLMKKMGWAGGGLGKNAQGIVEPIFTATSVKRAGLGAFDNRRDCQLAEGNLKTKMGLEGGGIRKNAKGIVEPILPAGTVKGVGLEAFDTGRDFQLAVENLIREWMQSRTNKDLRFSRNFNRIARREIHNIANGFGAMSRSYGKRKKRRLVISRFKGQGVASADQCSPANEPVNNLMPSPESQNSIQTHQAQFSVPSEPNVIPKRLDDSSGPLRKYVLLHMPGVKQSVHSLMSRITSSNKAVYNCVCEPLKSGQTKCTVHIDGQKVCEDCHLSPRKAKDNAVSTALEILRQQCYTLVIKSDAVGQSVSKSDLNLTVKTRVRPLHQQEEKLTESNNVGGKLMKMMGWTGGGLGKDEQGILEPILAATTVKRGGLGLTSASTSRDGGLEKGAQGVLEPILATSTIKSGGLGLTRTSTGRDYDVNANAVKKLIHEWIQSGAQKDLLFACDFSKKDRNLIHSIACGMGAKSTKCGRGSGKCLVLSRKQSLKDIVEELLQGCGNTEKYDLLEPGTPLPD